MTDKELAEKLTKLTFSPWFRELDLTDWERTFVAEVSAAWARFGSFKWKQRRKAAEILEKAESQMERRKLRWQWHDEAKEPGRLA